MKCVEITMKDDGTCKVKECEPKPEMPAAGGMMAAEPAEGDESGQTYPTVEEALAAAGEMLAGNEGAERASMEQAFQSAAKVEAG